MPLVTNGSSKDEALNYRLAICPTLWDKASHGVGQIQTLKFKMGQPVA